MKLYIFGILKNNGEQMRESVVAKTLNTGLEKLNYTINYKSILDIETKSIDNVEELIEAI